MTGRIPKDLEIAATPRVSSRFNLDLYGYVKLDAAYDSQRTNNGDVAFYAKPESGTGDDDSFSMTAKQTRFGMKLEAPECQDWKSTGGIEMDFYGSGSDNAANPRIRLAYLQLERNDWTILAGQHYDAWNTVLPKTVNFATMGKHGSLWSRRPQIRATREFRPAGDGIHPPLHPKFKLSGTLWTGENLGNFQGGVGQNLNLAQDSEIQATGGWIQASWYPTSTLNLSAAYGLDDPKDSDVSPEGRTRNETFFTNLYWTFIPSTTFGIEYQYLNTDYKTKNDASTHRIQSALIYKF